MEFLISQCLNGLVYGMLLFLLSAGLSLIFGLMSILNLAHGSFYMLGAFLGLSIFKVTGNFWLAMAISPILVAGLGAAIEMTFFRPLYKRGHGAHLDQMLLTVGFIFVFVDIVRTVWGGDVLGLPTPPQLSGAVYLSGIYFPKYRLFLIGLGLLLALALWLFIERSRLGAMLRAGVDDSDMASGLGINVSRLFTATFALGVGLAALAGVVSAPMVGLYAGMDIEFLIITLIVVVIGGMGSLKGAFVASMLIGEADTFGKAYLPDAAMFLIYLVMIFVLLVQPTGLFGVKQHG